MRRLARLLERTPLPKAASNPKVMNLFSYLPSVPRLARSRRSHWPDPPWDKALPELPADLRGSPGNIRDEDEANRSFAEDGPIPLWSDVYAQPLAYLREKFWKALLPNAPRVMRAYRKMSKQDPNPEASLPTPLTPSELTHALRDRARQLGISAVGVALYDERYTFGPYLDDRVGDRVIVCLMEQDWEATQTIPSLWAEQVVQRTYGELSHAALRLADYLRSLGYETKADAPFGTAVSIHYGVAAGLGQLGLNGQLLTPFAGSRVRIVLVRTSAPLVVDQPIDYGLEAICDSCRACVRRCPVSAIPVRRKYHRGVLKAKISSERCLPTVAQTEGCGICMKVCPVQRYGLPAIVEHWKQHGEVLGVESDELEGYVWPLDDQYYGPGSRPKSARQPEFLEPDGLDISVFDRIHVSGGDSAHPSDELNLPSV